MTPYYEHDDITIYGVINVPILKDSISDNSV